MSSTAPAKTPRASAAETIDAGFLESLVGYNTRRAMLMITPNFMQRMAVYELGMADFSVLSLIKHNPGITSRQLCTALSILPPNLVGLISTLDKRSLIERRPHPRDGRAMGLHLRPAGQKLMRDAERTVLELEQLSTANLSPAEQKTLIRLLQKIYA
ncbi:MarR family winged helix-turn-helix transcriptional regulator [Variovorax terrae]|uniref:MarR family transcriptional regulator n=1 Tax=Variovorax terrae TaxID=2923278 RepID=A0A9X2AMG2_9BURK|nr:MarR family transcriptional regulator [Variovorax terrae]MCJ0762740.1 MarR family transcriptional regulator [Variovorax terrae]